MFRLFQKILEKSLATNRSRKYLHYAIGEIALVVLGILIALQINNWNEERIEQKQIADYAHSLIKDLERDLLKILIFFISCVRRFTGHIRGTGLHGNKSRVPMRCDR
jgi:hypothetical protein